MLVSPIQASRNREGKGRGKSIHLSNPARGLSMLTGGETYKKKKKREEGKLPFGRE
jgi:hypothetical protein